MLFGDRLKASRKRAGIKQGELAIALGVSQAALSGYENGTRQPSVDILIRISRVLHVSIDFLLGVEDTLSVSLPSLLPKDEQLLIDNYRQLSDSNKRVLFKTSTYLLESEDMEVLLDKVSRHSNTV